MSSDPRLIGRDHRRYCLNARVGGAGELRTIGVVPSSHSAYTPLRYADTRSAVSLMIPCVSSIVPISEHQGSPGFSLAIFSNSAPNEPGTGGDTSAVTLPLRSPMASTSGKSPRTYRFSITAITRVSWSSSQMTAKSWK